MLQLSHSRFYKYYPDSPLLHYDLYSAWYDNENILNFFGWKT